MLWLKVGALSPQTQLEFIRKVSLAISSSVTFANIGMLWSLVGYIQWFQP